MIKPLRKTIYTKGILLCLLLVGPGLLLAQQPLKLWYKHPANEWTEALPLGNGHLGAMVFGGVTNEVISLNESTLWSGGPVKTNINPNSPKYLDSVRTALLVNHDYTGADRLEKKCRDYLQNRTFQWVICLSTSS